MASCNDKRPFSQELEMSQTTLTLTNDEQSSRHTTLGRGSSIEKVDHMQPALAYQQYLPEEHLSARANSICEENRQIRTYVESTLKQVEKRRLKLIKKKNRIEEEYAKLLETDNMQKQMSVELQMNLEEVSEQYRNEIQQRPQLVEKLNRSVYVTSLFESHFAEGSSVGLEIEKAKLDISLKFKECHERSKYRNLQTLKSNFMAEMEDKIRCAKQIREELMAARESNLHDIQDLTNQNIEKSNKINDAQDNMKQLIYNDQQLTTTFNDMAAQNKTLNEEILKLQNDLNEVKAVGNSDIQKLRLEINTEENNNSNLKAKSTEKEHCMNSSLTKLKELTNLTNQLKGANEETEIHNLELEKKIDEYRKQNVALNNEIKSLEQDIRKYDDVQNVNKCYKSKIHEFEENMKKSTILMGEKEESVKNLSKEFENLKQRLSYLDDNIVELNEDLKISTTAKKELVAKVLKNKLSYEDERKNKIVRNKKLENRNLDLSSELNKLLLDIEDMKNNKDSLKTEEKDLIALIKKNKEKALSSDEMLIVTKKELEEMSSEYFERISSKYNEWEKYEELLVMAKPTLDELPLIASQRAYLEQAIQEQREKYQKDVESMEKNQKSKMLEMDKEIENYRSIMKGLLQAEDKATEKIKENIKGAEKIKFKLEDEVNHLVKQSNKLKADEAKKRNKVTKVEKRLRAINNEVKVTRKDISDAISEKIQEVPNTKNIFKRSHKLMTPTSSLDSPKKHINEPPGKKVYSTIPSEVDSKLYSQVNTKKWVDSFPEDDEYEFSEI